MSKTWTDVLAALPDEAKPRRRAGRVRLTIEDGRQRRFCWSWSDDGCFDDWCNDLDAHAHIRCASLDYVRAWCKGNGQSLVISDSNGGAEVLITASFAIDLGSGPDEPSAWHAAVEYVKADLLAAAKEEER